MTFVVREEVHGKLVGTFDFEGEQEATLFVAKRAGDILFADSEARLFKSNEGELIVNDADGRVIYRYQLYEQ